VEKISYVKARELSVGNWVMDAREGSYVKIESVGTSDYNRSNKKYGYPTKTDDDNDRYAQVYNPIQKCSYKVHLGDLKPIALKTEMLRINQFEQCATAVCGYFFAPVFDGRDVLFHISEDSYEDTFHVEVFTDHNDNNYVLFNVCYVHELQNALRQCGWGFSADRFRFDLDNI